MPHKGERVKVQAAICILVSLMTYFSYAQDLYTSQTHHIYQKRSRVVYGDDNRVDVAYVVDKKIRTIAKSVAARVPRWSYGYNDEDQQGSMYFYDPPQLSDPWGANVCSDERFAKQPVISDCTGFLVGEDLLVTAGHCITDEGVELNNDYSKKCYDNQWLFDYDIHGDKSLDLQNITPDKMYNCKKVIFARFNEIHDYALVQLVRKVSDRQPLKFRRKGFIQKDTPLYVIGHPSGLPKKYAPGAKVISNSNKYFFSTNLDTFGGNSGSPVFNAITNEVEGILVRGKKDYIDSIFEGKSCRRVNRCNQNGKGCLNSDFKITEEVSRISFLLEYI